jgi:hypothetical protein
LLRDVDSPPTPAHPDEHRRKQWPAEHDTNGVDVLNLLRLNFHRVDQAYEELKATSLRRFVRRLIRAQQGN